MKLENSEAVANQFGDIEQIDRWPAGEIIFREGEMPRGVFVLYSGTVELIFSARTGVKKTLRTVLPGEIIGLSDAVSNTPHDCTATTHTGARIGFVPIEALRRQLENQPAMWLTVAKCLSADYDSCLASMRTLATAR